MNQHPATQASCKLCRSDRVEVLSQSRRYGFHVGRWAGCGRTFVLDRLAEVQLKEMYGGEQGFERFSDMMSNAKVRDRHARTPREIRPLMTDSSIPARLFDVGAGSGEFLNQAREVGFEVYGNELSDAAIPLARWRRVPGPAPGGDCLPLFAGLACV